MRRPFTGVQHTYCHAAWLRGCLALVLVGSDIVVKPDEDFEVKQLGDAIKEKLGAAAQVCFCIGLYAVRRLTLSPKNGRFSFPPPIY